MTGEFLGATDDQSQRYAREVGARLRGVRRDKRLSLHEVEARSAHEFKASVLGAYERGERVISVPRLQRLAEVYFVPIERLLPAGDDSIRSRGATASASPERLTFDLRAFDGVDDTQLDMVRRYVNSVVGMRRESPGPELTVRRDDVRAIAGMFGVDPPALVSWLDRHQVATPR